MAKILVLLVTLAVACGINLCSGQPLETQATPTREFSSDKTKPIVEHRTQLHPTVEKLNQKNPDGFDRDFRGFEDNSQPTMPGVGNGDYLQHMIPSVDYGDYLSQIMPPVGYRGYSQHVIPGVRYGDYPQHAIPGVGIGDYSQSIIPAVGYRSLPTIQQYQPRTGSTMTINNLPARPVVSKGEFPDTWSVAVDLQPNYNSDNYQLQHQLQTVRSNGNWPFAAQPLQPNRGNRNYI